MRLWSQHIQMPSVKRGIIMEAEYQWNIPAFTQIANLHCTEERNNLSVYIN